MSSTNLTEEQGFALLSRLADDDGFRARFEAAPARALVEIGVSAEVVVQLDADCLERRRLASKETFRSLLAEKSGEAICCAMKMIVPTVGFAGKTKTRVGLTAKPQAGGRPSSPSTAERMH